ncbi:MAG: hypothetical protein KDD70_08910 [Bdellovibrionales bacterium]|nr:hypothetical protein [Bdellovibrionales bacterium]
MNRLLFCLLSLLVFTGTLPPSPAFAQRKKGAIKFIDRDFQGFLIGGANEFRRSYQQLISLEQRQGKLNEKLSAATINLANTQQSYDTNKQLLEDALTHLFQLETEKRALETIFPYQNNLKLLAPLFADQALDPFSSRYIDAYFIDRRAAMSGIIQFLSQDIGRIRSLLADTKLYIEQTAAQLDAMATGAGTGFYGFSSNRLTADNFLEQIFSDYAQEVNRYDVLRAYFDGRNLAENSFSPTISCSPGSRPTLFNRFDDLLALTASASDYALFLSNPNGLDFQEVILEPYYGNASTNFLGRVSNAQACASTLVNDINFLFQEITNSLAVENTPLAYQQNLLSSNVSRLYQLRSLIADIVAQQPILLNQISSIAASVSNTGNGTSPTAWKRAIQAIIEDYELLNSFHPQVYLLLRDFLILAQTELNTLNTTYEDQTDLGAAYKIVAGKLRAISSGGLARMDEQLNSSSSALIVLAQDIAAGELPLLESFDTWFFNTDFKAQSYFIELNQTLPAAITAAQGVVQNQQALFQIALNNLQVATARQKGAEDAFGEYSTIQSNLRGFFQSVNANIFYTFLKERYLERAVADRRFRSLAGTLDSTFTKSIAKLGLDLDGPLQAIPKQRKKAPKIAKLFNRRVTRGSVDAIPFWVDELSQNYFDGDTLSSQLFDMNALVN